MAPLVSAPAGRVLPRLACVLLVVVASACGGAPSPPPPQPDEAGAAAQAPEPPASSPPAPETESAGPAEPTAPTPPAAPALPPRIAALDEACQKGDGKACWDAGVAYERGPEVERDEAMQMRYFRAACDHGRVSGCYNVGAAMFHGQLGQKVDRAGSLVFFEKACAGRHEGGCYNLAIAHLKGEGVAVDRPRGRKFLASACELGNPQACDLAKSFDAEDARAAGKAQGVAGANLSVGSITVDGLTTRDLSCRVEGGGGGLLGALAGPAVLVGSLAKKRAQLDRCAPQGAEVRVLWTFKGGRVTRAAAEAENAALKSCVEAVVKTAVHTSDGDCAATLVLGKP